MLLMQCVYSYFIFIFIRAVFVFIFKRHPIVIEYCSCGISHIQDIFTFRRILRSIKPGLRGNIDVLELNCDVTKACTIDRIQSKLSARPW